MIQIKKCIICNHSRFEVVTEKGQYFSGEKVMFCLHCGMFFLSPQMTPAELESFYQSNLFSKEFRGNDIPDEEMVAYRDMRAERRLNFLTEKLKQLPDGPVLEIGCSCGNFLKLLAKRGYNVFGIDPSQGFADYAKNENGLNVIPGMYPQNLSNEFQGPFAAIAAFQVLEHTTDPRFVLESINTHLLDNGMLFLEIPDIARAVSRRKYIYPDYFQKSHLWDFCRSTIFNLLEDCNFCIDNFYYEHKPPYDKNLLIVARKQKEKIIPRKDNNMMVRPRRFLFILKIKMLLGRFVKIVRSAFSPKLGAKLEN